MLKPPKALFETDVCIVGAGPAGLSLARELSKYGLRICVIESGIRKLDKAGVDLNVGEVESPQGYRRETLRDGRRRQLGGSANLWNHELRGCGKNMIRYVPLDEIDFEFRDWIPLSGWPFSRRDLLPFYERAHRACEIGPFAWSAEDWRGKSSASQPWQTQALESIVSQFGHARVFLNDYPLALSRIPNVSLFQASTLLNLKTDTHRPDEISLAEVAQADGGRFTVKARQFVLASGGLENARILLLNEATRNGGPGNQHDLVGRCFMDHPSITLGTITPSTPDIYDRATFFDQHDVQGMPIMGKLHLRQEVMRREKLLNACAVLVPYFKNIRNNLAPVIRQIAAKGPGFVLRRSYPETSGGTPAAPPGTELSLRRRLLESYYSERFCGWSRLSGKARRFGDIAVRSLVEQSPDLANRVILGDAVDGLGQRRIKLSWRWNEVDLRSIRRTQEIFREELAAAGIGAFKPSLEEDEGIPRLFFSPHHFMGTTRMHNDPHQGVVDANCRVHGLQNLFVTGCSVFPTGGFANPTLTIVALALRLADHLGNLMTMQKAPVSDQVCKPATANL